MNGSAQRRAFRRRVRVPRSRELGVALLIAACLASLRPVAACAQPIEASAAQVSRDLFRDGVRASQQGDWLAARTAFARAFELVQRPVILLNLASAQAHTSLLVEAAESYRRFLREASPQELSQYRAQAETALRELEARTPHVRIVADDLGSDEVVQLAGAPLQRAFLGANIPLDPGTYTFVRARGGNEVARVDVTLAERETRDVVLAPASPAAVPAHTPSPSSLAPEAQPAAVLLGQSTEPPTTGERRLDADYHEPGLLESPWFWGGAVVVVAAVVVGVVLATSGSAQSPYGGDAPAIFVGR